MRLTVNKNKRENLLELMQYLSRDPGK